MRQLKQNDGFTLIELMIVVAIIAIIAAIAIPSILRSRMSANQTSAVSSLDTILKMNTQFRSNDAENNGENDYWTENVWGFYGIQSAGGDRIELFSRSLAEADWEGSNDQGNINGNTGGNFSIDTSFSSASAKSGYYVSMFPGLNDGGSGTTTTSCDSDYDDGDASAGNTGSFTNSNRFGVSAFPELYDSTGTKAYALDQGGDKFEIDAKNSNYTFSGSDDTPNSSEGTAPLECKPSEDSLNTDWGTVG